MTHRIEFMGKLPMNCYLAVSGGADSMAILDFLIKGGRNIIVLHFNHGTEHGKEAEAHVEKYCKEHNLELIVGYLTEDNDEGLSPEHFWREQRYKFFSNHKKFRKFGRQVATPIITCHNLDDQVENWIFTSIRNENPSIIPYKRWITPYGTAAQNKFSPHVLRPFLITKKKTLEDWCERHNVPYVVDPGNTDFKHTRSFIRSEMVPRALQINPGLYKLMRKKVEKSIEFYNLS
jgi:tRNA(Ile)-lysidine synthase